MAQHPRAEEFDWFAPATVVALVAKIQALWLTHGTDKVRLEVHRHGNDVNLRVVGDDADGDTDSPPDNDDDDQPLNDSHRCPPDCP